LVVTNNTYVHITKQQHNAQTNLPIARNICYSAKNDHQREHGQGGEQSRQRIESAPEIQDLAANLSLKEEKVEI
jgi:hypothetical protein